jgi:hypothetical protein
MNKKIFTTITIVLLYAFGMLFINIGKLSNETPCYNNAYIVERANDLESYSIAYDGVKNCSEYIRNQSIELNNNLLKLKEKQKELQEKLYYRF